MSPIDEREVFAYGMDECDGHECPAVTAGFASTRRDLEDVIEVFDDRLAVQENKNAGSVSDQVAREQWNEAIDVVDQRGRHTNVSTAEEIAEKLGWD